MTGPGGNAPDLRLIVITDRDTAAPRDTIDIVRAALEAGAPAIQLRDKTASARSLYQQTTTLLALTRAHHALLFVNDRLDVALAAGADGAHLGPHDMPIAAARHAAPRPFLLGASADDPDVARRATRNGADYIGCGAVFGTASKDVGEERIGTQQLARVVRAVDVPVVGIGGVAPDNIGRVADTGAAGAAVIRAVMAADRPGAVVSKLLTAFAPG